MDFLLTIRADEVGLDPKLSGRSSPSGDKFLINVLKDLNISSQDSIIDIGCGKGNAMRAMLKFPFRRVDGVEISKQIADMAIHNFNRLGEYRCTIHNQDAASFSEYCKYNVIYLYDPFHRSIMLGVICSIIQSMKEIDREVVIVYNNPVSHEVIISDGVFRKVSEYPDEWGNGIYVYSNREGGNSRLAASKPFRRGRQIE